MGREIIGELSFENIELCSLDSYDEVKISKKILLIGTNECYRLALQVAIIGIGNKNYGKFMYQNVEIDMITFMKNNGIKYNNDLNDKLSDDDLTPRRLCRFFRDWIEIYLENGGRQSYLYSKYCPSKDDSLIKYVFPGSEYSIENNEEGIKRANVLAKTYKNLDSVLNINISNRIKRIMLAKGFQNNIIEEMF